MTVDAKLEIKPGRASRSYPNGSNGFATLHVGVPRHGNILQIPIQTEVLAAVIDDDQAAESRECVGIRDYPGMNGPYRESLVGGDVDAVVHAPTRF